MPFRHISYGSEFGIVLHESGLNAVSAGLRAQKPELFAFKTDIPIVRPSGSDPGHILTLYAVADEPIAFNLYPVSTTPQITEDSFFIGANILFTLTDSKLGSVTRIRIKVEAAGQIVRRGDQLNVRLAPKADGSPWFDITSIEGEHPGSLSLLDGKLDGNLPITNALADNGDEETARSFRAIMNYLITLFLKEGLTQVVTEFPLPSLANLIEAGPLGKLPGRDLFVRNDAIYLTLGNAVPGDGGFPAAFPRADLAIGVNEKGLQRALDALAPMPIAVDVGADNTVLRVRSSNFHIRRIKTNLLAGSDHLLAQVFFGGTLKIRLQFKVFGKWLRPELPLPIDATFSQYAGLVRPYLQIVNAGQANERLELRMEPDSRFVELWLVLLVTNYRGYFRNVFEDLIKSVKDNLVYKVLKKIPIIGWIVDKVIDLTADVLAWALGAPLDLFMSTFLSSIVNTLGRAALTFFKRPEFTALKIEQSMVKDLTGLTIRGGSIHQLEDGRGGELFLGLSFAEGQFPAPPAPTPLPGEPGPEPIPEPEPIPTPNLPWLPEYGATAFEPAFAMPVPAWSDGALERYSLETSGGRALLGTMEVRYEQVGDGWRITKRTKLDGIAKAAIAVADYSPEGRPLKAVYRQEVGQQVGDASIEFEQAVDFGQAGKALTSATIGPAASFERRIDVLDRAHLDLDEFWPFRLGHSPLEDGTAGKFGRVEFAGPMEAANWSRQIPVSITVTQTDVVLPGEVDPTAAFMVSAVDEDGKTQVIAVPGRGVAEIRVTTKEGAVTVRRLW